MLSLRVVTSPVLVTAEHAGRPILYNSSIGKMSAKTFFTTLMRRVACGDLLQRIPHQHLIVRSREDGGWDVDQNGDPGIVLIGENFSAEEDGGDDASAQVSGQVGRDGDTGEAPDHTRVGQTDDERYADG